MLKMPEQIMSKEMIQYSDDRTKMHIDFVQKYGNILIDKFADDSDEDSFLREKIKLHDYSKMHDVEEYMPYIKINWSYKLKQEGKEGLEYTDDMHNATFHHIITNQHHPEFWSPNPNINKNDRDKSAELVDATRMPKFALLEMVADWNAISKERNTNTTRQWADDNINKRWKFTKEQIDFIYECIETLERVEKD